MTNEEINEINVRIREGIDRLFETELEKILAWQSKKEDFESEKSSADENKEEEEGG